MRVGQLPEFSRVNHSAGLEVTFVADDDNRNKVFLTDAWRVASWAAADRGHRWGHLAHFGLVDLIPKSYRLFETLTTVHCIDDEKQIA